MNEEIIFTLEELTTIKKALFVLRDRGDDLSIWVSYSLTDYVDETEKPEDGEDYGDILARTICIFDHHYLYGVGDELYDVINEINKEEGIDE